MPIQTDAALNLLQELPLRFDSHSDSSTTLQLAREHRLTVYDALIWNSQLLTFDAQLREAARRMGVGDPIIAYYCNLPNSDKLLR